MEIKTISDRGMRSLSRPKDAHVGQLQFYMAATGLKKGSLLYINRDNPEHTQTFNVMFDPSVHRRNLEDLEAARSAATSMVVAGEVPTTWGYGYSRMDRLSILGDVAPYSDEYKEELSRVASMKKLGLLSTEQENEFAKVKQRRAATMRRHELYPYRFKFNQIMNPDKETQILSDNENIKAGAEYSLPERILGGAWEWFSHLDSPLHTKFMNYRSPVEHYERSQIYGRQSAFWTNPYRDFISPYATSLVQTTDPAQGAISFGLLGGLFINPAMAPIAAGVGVAYGAVNGGLNAITNRTWIPKKIREQRKISDYFDKVEYEKFRRLHDATGNPEYEQSMAETMTGVNPFGVTRQDWTNIFRAVPYAEKPFMNAFIHTPEGNERDKIRDLVPAGVRNILEAKWAQQDSKIAPPGTYMSDRERSGMLTKFFKSHYLPDRTWTGWDPEVRMDDIKMKTVQKEGHDAHDWGLGWYDQERRIANSPYTPGPIDMYRGGDRYNETPTKVKPGQLRGIIQKAARAMKVNTSVTISESGGDSSVCNVNLNVSFSMPEGSAIRNYSIANAV
jgi:hypothetical protein